MEFKKYKRKGCIEARSYTPFHKNQNEEVYLLQSNGVSISKADIFNGSPKKGDMIARNPNDPNDMWLISKEYFEKNYEN